MSVYASQKNITIMTTRVFLTRLNQATTKEGRALINDFFIIFSRFEYALKTSGFANGDEDRVIANWETYASAIRQDFDNSIKSESVQDAIVYLTQHPPRVQNYSNGNLGWHERIFETNQPLINKLCLSLRDIRNNLFHGGKFSGNYQEDISRNYILLKSAIKILNHWLQLNQTVEQNFFELIL